MGVTSLWQILEPIKQHVPLSHLKGKTLAVDLSLWVCEAQSVKKMAGVVTKPHLRNLFFRVSSLTLMGIRLVFVMEGDAPKLKADTMSKRSEIRFGHSIKPGAARTGRSHFRSFLKECLEMLECLGIPWVQAAGEAEAMCAYLNAQGYVDGCITNDGDAFLYGAQTVYRNFTMNIKDPHVDCYSIFSIEKMLGCNRECLIGLAILLGCDYLPKGVPGVGKEQALKLIRTLGGQSLLQRFEQWKDPFQYGDIPAIQLKKVVHCTVCCHPGYFKEHERVGCQLCESVEFCKPHEATYLCPCDWHFSERDRQVRMVEDSIRKKAKACEGFPFPEVIQEYLVSKDKLMKPYKCQRPNLLSFQKFASEKMDWPRHYACEKLCALLTYYDMNRRKAGHTDPWQLQALRIVKTRTKNGIPCFEIEWQKPEHFATADDQSVEPFLITTEESSLFQAAYPEIIALYQMEKLEICKEKKKGKKAKLKKKEDLAANGEVADLLSRLNLQSSCEIFPDRNPKYDFKSDCQVLPTPNCKSQVPFVSVSFSAEVLSSQNSPSPLLASPPQNARDECNFGGYLSSQIEFIDSSMDSCASSAITNLPLGDIDWEGTSFSISPAPVNNSCSESEWRTHSNSTGHRGPRHCKTTDIIPLFSNSVQCNQDPPRSVECSVSGSSNLPEGQNCSSSKGQVILKLSALESFSRDPEVSLLGPLQMTEQTKGTSSPEGEFSNVLAQQNDSLQRTEIVLPKKYPREFSLENNIKLPKQSEYVSQKPTSSSMSRSVSLCIETVEPTHSGNEPVMMFPEPTKDLDNCQMREDFAQMSVKNSLKSVCQSGYSSSEESDGGNVEVRRKAPGGPQWQKKRSLVQLKDNCRVKRSDSKSELEIKLKGKVSGADLLAEEHPKPASVAHVHSSPSPINVACSYLQDSGSEADVWADSPLPLSERLKLRL
ncbi:PREDICTED: flap endonuclease GEN homolog 1 [Gekko japonicus]|uniref:Flap endonuclease GEN homolog 1 n=1 Tax=Gekko japonicus TaxID=146911 RepID=A0ABM1KZW8_GEKJA|nr:PREDICTED: flap endonuclease GEN homolog 1 [Gekko japonicus]